MLFLVATEFETIVSDVRRLEDFNEHNFPCTSALLRLFEDMKRVKEQSHSGFSIRDLIKTRPSVLPLLEKVTEMGRAGYNLGDTYDVMEFIENLVCEICNEVKAVYRVSNCLLCTTFLSLKFKFSLKFSFKREFAFAID